MDDGVLASLLARDLRLNLEGRAPNLRDVYGFCLWVDDIYGDFLASLATEAWFGGRRRLPAYAALPDEKLFRLDGLRWSVGDWHGPDDDFMSEETKAALEPLVSRLTDDTLPDAVQDSESARWRELAFAVLELGRPLDVLPGTADAIAFVICGDSDVEEQVETMSRTVPAEQLPPWRRHDA